MKMALQKHLDRLGLALAGACGIHCLLTPLLILAFPFLAGTFLTKEIFHLGMLFVVAPTTGAAAYLGCRRHRDASVIWLLGAGLVLLGGAVLIGHETTGESFERLATLAGVFLLAVGHVRNWRLCSRRESR